MKKIENFFYFIISVFFPKICSCCGKNLPFNYKENICFECKKALPLNNGLTCQKCSLPLSDGGAMCNDCKRNKDIFFNFLLSPYIYKDNITLLLKKFKYNKKTYLAKDLSYEMLNLIYEKNLNNQIDFVVPLPLHFLKKFKRGFNQAELLAKEIARNINKPIYSNLLIRTKYTTPQFNLNREERTKNLEKVFCVNKKYTDMIKNKNILLIDDIATTCTSANLCSKELKTMGAKNIFVITVARD
jgi:ComF family protein